MATPVKPNPFDERFIRRLLLSTPTIFFVGTTLKTNSCNQSAIPALHYNRSVTYRRQALSTIF